MTLDPAVAVVIQEIEAPGSTWTDEKLTAHGRELFSRQLRLNAPYAAFCAKRGVGPQEVTHWGQIPAVPTDAFKVARLSCAAGTAVQRTFFTSGTTAASAGAHHMGPEGVAAYTASLRAPFHTHVLAGLRARAPFFLLAPGARVAPHSSLSFMLDTLVSWFGHPTQSRHFVLPTPAPDGPLALDTAALARALERHVAECGEPLVLLGTAFAFAALFEDTDVHLVLPAGSRLMETGGFKGRTMALDRDGLFAAFTERLGLEPTHCISEYSMTELSSQAYTTGLGALKPPASRAFVPPPWARIQVVDPVTFEPLESPGSRGLIRWFDLANVDSVLAIQTSDIGTLTREGVVLHGRAKEAELRGCSLAIEELRHQKA